MAFICIGLAYAVLLVLVIRYYKAVHRWDDESDALAAEEQLKASEWIAACDDIRHPFSDLPPVIWKRHQEAIFIKEVSIWEKEQGLEILAQIPSLREGASSGGMKHFAGFSIN